MLQLQWKEWLSACNLSFVLVHKFKSKCDKPIVDKENSVLYRPLYQNKDEVLRKGVRRYSTVKNSRIYDFRRTSDHLDYICQNSNTSYYSIFIQNLQEWLCYDITRLTTTIVSSGEPFYSNILLSQG